MNLSKQLCLVLACTLVVFTGCLKKPQRPTPDQTMGAGSNTLVGGPSSDFQNPADAIPVRDPNGVYEEGDKIFNLLKPVMFDFDKSSIKESERAKLQAAKEYLAQHPEQRLLIEGHCDWRGTAEYNLGLGDRRANAAKSYLVKIGVPADKVEVLSKGALEAKEKGTGEEMAHDRRDELIVLKK
ncbi:MAG: OmpA family protein [Nibricoccus sp.]